jgi:endoglucanase
MKAASLLWLMAGAASAAPAIKVNQLGFAPASHKLALVAGDAVDRFEVVAASGKTVFRGALGPANIWKPAQDKVRVADFSALTTPGNYRIKTPDGVLSDSFTIAPHIYRALNAAALKAFYFNRSGTALEPRYAGAWARSAGHPDDKVLVHASAASAARPEGTPIYAARGWYDAGDYNKYITSSAIATYTLLAAYEHFPDYFKRQDVRIPESGNQLPDILDEALWNLAWMLSMQDPHDGGVYHKLTNRRFDAMVMPGQAMRAPRYVVQKSTAATLDFAATMAVASRVMKPFDAALAQRMLAAAEAAWTWAQAHPAQHFSNPPDVVTGEYGDLHLEDERAWAAAELYITSARDSYYTALQIASVSAGVPAWDDVRALAWVSLAHHRTRLTPLAERKLIERRVDDLAAGLAREWTGSAYKLAMKEADFVWGSNAVVLNQSLMLLQGYRINPNPDYLRAAQSGLDYVLGRNAVGMSFVTGFGSRAPLHPHHRPSQADQVAAPVPGFLTGGPQPGQQDKAECRAYPSALAALSYLDDACSFASNEVAINWNAPLVYVSAALDELTPKDTMSIDDAALAAIVRQEQTLQFDAFDSDKALEVGLKLVAMARASKQAVAVDITHDGSQLFFHRMPGTTRENADWIRRKSNLVKRTGHSSFYTHTEVKNGGGDIDAIAALDVREYAAHGGSFPLTIRGQGMVGTITVSGLPGPDDHALVVQALRQVLQVKEEL